MHAVVSENLACPTANDEITAFISAWVQAIGICCLPQMVRKGTTCVIRECSGILLLQRKFPFDSPAASGRFLAYRDSVVLAVAGKLPRLGFLFVSRWVGTTIPNELLQ